MSLLDDFSRFAEFPATHPFPRMWLMAGDHEPHLVVGSGELRIVSPTRFEYTLVGVPENPGYVIEQMRRQRDNRYDGLKRFRLVLEDADGKEYSGGWTVPRIDTGAEGWSFEGVGESLIGDGQTEPSPSGSTEARFDIPKDHHVSLMLARFVSTPQEAGRPVPRYELEVLGETVTFVFDSHASTLTISTPASEAFPLTYTRTG